MRWLSKRIAKWSKHSESSWALLLRHQLLLCAERCIHTLVCDTLAACIVSEIWVLLSRLADSGPLMLATVRALPTPQPLAARQGWVKLPGRLLQPPTCQASAAGAG